jgi:hypothetical protein
MHNVDSTKPAALDDQNVEATLLGERTSQALSPETRSPLIGKYVRQEVQTSIVS